MQLCQLYIYYANNISNGYFGICWCSTIQIGTYYGSTVTLPIDANCHYSYSQQIYLQSQIDRS